MAAEGNNTHPIVLTFFNGSFRLIGNSFQAAPAPLASGRALIQRCICFNVKVLLTFLSRLKQEDWYGYDNQAKRGRCSHLEQDSEQERSESKGKNNLI